jgi:hypothetical protein
MSATLCACTFPQPPNEGRATFSDDLGDPLSSAAGPINLVLMIVLAALLVSLARSALSLMA